MTTALAGEDRRPSPKAIIGLWLALLLAHAPLLSVHLSQMWRRPHYRFFPLLVGVVCILMWRRRTELRDLVFVRGAWLERGLLALSVSTLSVAVVLGSPFLAATSAVLATGFALVHVWGLRVVPYLFGTWMLLWFIVPPPLGADLTLISQLQALTSRLSSQVLDWLEVDHLMSGNVLHIGHRTFLIDEACSGVHSLFALLAASAVSLVMASRGVRRGAVLMLLTVAWAVLFNLVRVLAIALAHAWWQVDLSTGWIHEALGMVVFAAALLLVLSSDQLLHWAGYWLKSLTRPLRRRPRSYRYYAGHSRRARWADDVPDTSPAPVRSIRPRTRLITGIACAAYGLLFVAELSGLMASQPRRFTHDPFPELSRDFLPPTLDDWSLQNYEAVERDFSSDFGKHSNRWIYRSGDLEVAIAVDRLFFAWHELSRCYEGQGWKLTSREALTDTLDAEYLHQVHATFDRETGEQGWLVFSLLDGSAQALTPPSTNKAKRLVDRLRSPETLQLQVFVASEIPLTAAERERVTALFQQVAGRLQVVIRARAQESSDG